MNEMKSNRINISSGAPWETIVGYSRAVKVGPLIEVTGTTAVENGKVVGINDPEQQATIVFQKIKGVLEQAGSCLEDVIRTRMFVTDISMWEAFGRAHKACFGDIMPATSMIEVKGLIDPDMLIEVEVTAWAGDSLANH